jgi:nucleotide-binding universal stress UspA family protein
MGKIVVGVDGSEESARALDWAVEEAQLRGLRLEVVYAYDHQPEWLRYGPPPTLEGLTLEDIERSQAQPGAPSAEAVGREHAEALLRSMLTEDVERKGVKVQRTIADEQKPAPFLVERSQDAELLVVGSRGRGSVGSMLLGSVSTHCVHHASCPVVVIK